MSEKSRVSVRQWQEKYRDGAFQDKDLEVQRQAGWRDWRCRWDALAGRLKRIAPIVMGIEEPFILDNFSISFTNVRAPSRNTVYDCVHFAPLDGRPDGYAFRINFRNPSEPDKWMLYTKRFGFIAPEYGCSHVQEMLEYISNMAHDLEQGVRPLFLDEQAAAVRYVQGLDPLYSSGAVCRTGDHSYSFLTWNGCRKTVRVACRLKDVPPDFQKFGTMKIKGLYVYCLEDGGELSPPPSAPKRKTSKKKGVTR